MSRNEGLPRRRLRRVLRWLGRGLAVLLILLLLAGVGGYAYLWRSLPTVDGVIKTTGLGGPVEIVRDTDAVPHIIAQNKADAFFGLGYVHAQDRLWQMESQRRLGQGRLAETFGDSVIGLDRFMRTLGIMRAAQQSWERLPADTKTIVNAYVAGINAFITDRRGSRLPPEFTLIGIEPAPWTGPDALIWPKLLAFDLSGNYFNELQQRELINIVGPQRARELMPFYPEDGPTIMQAQANTTDYEPLIAMVEEVRALTGVDNLSGDGLGSNNWVVDGSKSTTGKPILANDPHTGSQTPMSWYLAHLSAGDFDVIGATFPGVPSVVIGRNRFIAWGETNLNPDVQDLFYERLDPTGTMAEFKGQWEPMQTITETIKVKGGADVPLVVHSTRHGPLISDLVNDNIAAQSPPAQRPPPIGPIALRWTALDPEDNTIMAFLRMNEAHNWTEFKDALRYYSVPAQNFVYADVEGNIGYYAPGHIPIRLRGDGSIPVEGWTGDNEWNGWIPFEQLPQLYNPPEHFIATANNRPVPADYPYLLGREWSQTYRIKRITELLQAKDKLSPDDFAAIQGDTTSLLAREFVPLLLPLVTPRSDLEQRALDLLRNWDGDTSAGSPAAAVFEAWYARLGLTLVGDELKEPRLIDQYRGSFTFTSRFMAKVFKDRDNPWCDNVTTPERENCTTVAEQTFRAALGELQSKLGADINSWRWDRLHTIFFPHQPFDNIEFLRPFFSRSTPAGGDGSTINLGAYSFLQPYRQLTVPGYRQIIDMASMQGGRYISATGQSGHFLSAHYDDYLADWRAVRYRPMRFDRDTVERDRRSTLRLEPEES